MINRGAGLSAAAKEGTPKERFTLLRSRPGVRENIPRTVAAMRRAIHLTTSLFFLWAALVAAFLFGGGE